MSAHPTIDPELDSRTWRDRTGRHADDLNRVFAWLELHPTVWWHPAAIAAHVGISRRRARSASEVLVGEWAIERQLLPDGHQYRLLVW